MFKATDQAKTLDRLKKAMDKRQPVTISYVRADGTETVRTIEIFEIPEELTKGGKQIVRAMDRNGNSRTWRVDRIVEFTVHRSRYVVPRCPKHNVHPDDCFVQGRPEGSATGRKLRHGVTNTRCLPKTATTGFTFGPLFLPNPQ